MISNRREWALALKRVAFFASALTWSMMCLAQTPSLGRSIEAGEPRPKNALKADELKRCVELDQEIEVLTEDVGRLQGDVDTAESRQKAAGKWLDERQAALDHTKVPDVDRYNQAIDEHSILVRDYNTLLPAFNAQVELHNVAIREFNENCADRPYLRKDWLQLK